MKTTVIHIRNAPRGWQTDPLFVYIGRPSAWGNPYHISSTMTREEAITAYERLHLLRFDPAKIRTALHEKILVCYCKPKPCHGDVLARIADTT